MEVEKRSLSEAWKRGTVSIQERLDQLGVILPDTPSPAGAYTPALKIGNLVQTSGQLPIVDGRLFCEGQLGTKAVTEHRATEAAHICALNALAAAAAVSGGVDQLKRVVKVTGFVSSTETFYAQPSVLNGASKLFEQIFDGPHTRSAVGVAALPLNASVEIEVTFELR